MLPQLPVRNDLQFASCNSLLRILKRATCLYFFKPRHLVVSGLEIIVQARKFEGNFELGLSP